MRRLFAIGKGRVIVRRAGVATLVLSIVCAATGTGLVAFDVLSSTNGFTASTNTPPPGPSLSLPPGGTQVLGLTINPPSNSANSSNATSQGGAVGPQSSGGARSGSSGAANVAFAPAVVPPNPIPSPPAPAGSSARSILTYVRDQLVTQLPGVTDKDNKKRTQDAIDSLTAAIDPGLWIGGAGGDGNHVVDKTANKVFDNAKQAVQKLSDVKKPVPPWVQPLINDVDFAVRQLANVMISENTCTPDKSKELDAAVKEMSKGDDEYNKSHYPQAIDHYKNAWDHGGKAKGEPCVTAGLTVSPSGALFTVTKMVPKDQTSATIQVQITGTDGSVTLSEANIVSPSPNLAHHLLLTVHDNASGVDVYGPDAPLDSTGAINLCGTGAGCPAWAAGESHTFVFSVTFPNGANENLYQGTSASLDFVWTRS